MATSDPFERHGITHLSPSSLRLWRDAPSVWIGKYLLRATDEVGPGAWRGQAVEAGVDRLLFNLGIEAARAAMRQKWDDLAQGLIEPNVAKESDALDAFLDQAALAFASMPVPLTRQTRMELTLPGISVPLLGFADWVFPDHGTDLKTTWRMPSSPTPDHVEQVAFYAMCSGKPFSLTYVTNKKWTRYEVTASMAAEGWDRLIETAQAVRSFLSRVDGAHDALSMFAPDYTDFHFSPPMAEAVRAAKAARVLPGERNHQPLHAVE
jgi:hypothetical protein